MKKKSDVVKNKIKNDKIIDFNKSSEKMHRKKKKKKVDIINLLILVFILSLVPNIVKQNITINNLEITNKNNTIKLEKLMAKSNELSKQVASIDDENVMLKVVERIARDDYKMVKPNEIIYIDNKKKDKFIPGIGTNDELVNSDNVDSNDDN